MKRSVLEGWVVSALIPGIPLYACESAQSSLVLGIASASLPPRAAPWCFFEVDKAWCRVLTYVRMRIDPVVFVK